MKVIHWIVAAAALSFVQPAQAGVNDPEVIIYRFSALFDNGGSDFQGVATVFHCTNFSGVDEHVRIVLRLGNSAIASNFPVTIAHLNTAAVATHPISSYMHASMNTTGFFEGTAAIAATSINVTCTAMVIDAANARPDGLVVHGIRFNPVPGSQE